MNDYAGIDERIVKIKSIAKVRKIWQLEWERAKLRAKRRDNHAEFR